MSVACLNFGHPEIGYVNGFRMIADLAVQHVLDTGNDQDYLVYPIVFSYRQYLELRIKGLLGDASQLLDAADPPSQLRAATGSFLSGTFCSLSSFRFFLMPLS